MALTKATKDVLSIPDISTSLVTDNTPGGLNALLSSTYAAIASPSFTGAPTSVTPLNTSNNTQIATTAFVNSVLAAGSYGKNSKTTGSGPKVFVSTAVPSGGADDDIWLQYV